MEPRHGRLQMPAAEESDDVARNKLNAREAFRGGRRRRVCFHIMSVQPHAELTDEMAEPQ